MRFVGRAKNFLKFNAKCALLIFLTLSCGARVSEEIEGEGIDRVSFEVEIEGERGAMFSWFDFDPTGGLHFTYFDYRAGVPVWLWIPSEEVVKAMEEKRLRISGQKEYILPPDSPGTAGLNPVVAVDSKGIPHVIFIRHTEVFGGVEQPVFSLWYTKRVGNSVWTPPKMIEPLFHMTASAIKLDVAKDPTDKLYISYIGTDKRVYFIALRPNGDVFESQIIDPFIGISGEAGKETEIEGGIGGLADSCVSIHLDFQGRLHVAYYDSENGNLKYAVRNLKSTKWKIYVVGWERYSEQLKFVTRRLDKCIFTTTYPMNPVKSDVVILKVTPGRGREIIPPLLWDFKSIDQIEMDQKVCDNTSKYIITYFRADLMPEDEGIYCDVDSDPTTLSPVFAFYNSTRSKIMFASFDIEKGKWTIEEAADAVVSSRISLVMYPTEKGYIPVILWMDPANWDIMTAVKREGRWSISRISVAGNIGASLVAKYIPQLKQIGIAHILYKDGEYYLAFSLFKPKL